MTLSLFYPCSSTLLWIPEASGLVPSTGSHPCTRSLSQRWVVATCHLLHMGVAGRLHVSFSEGNGRKALDFVIKMAMVQPKLYVSFGDFLNSQENVALNCFWFVSKWSCDQLVTTAARSHVLVMPFTLSHPSSAHLSITQSHITSPIYPLSTYLLTTPFNHLSVHPHSTHPFTYPPTQRSIHPHLHPHPSTRPHAHRTIYPIIYTPTPPTYPSILPLSVHSIREMA